MNECQISGCRELQTTCVTCGRVVCTKTFSAPGEWISVKDRLPEEEDYYLTWVIDNGASYYFEVQKFDKMPRTLKEMYGNCITHWEKSLWDDRIVTHWMKLPNPPKDTNET